MYISDEAIAQHLMKENTMEKIATKVLAKSELEAYAKATGASAQIRYLASLGWARGDIARYTGKRYQHVRNVLITPLKRPA